MAHLIDDETIEYVSILAKLDLSEAQKEQAKKDMGRMLDYMDKLNELDTTGIEPASHIFQSGNVFREDIVTGGDGSNEALANAPRTKENMYQVPKTIG
ncbi:MAG: Asp-tRNA(Asn)/Glu-tRNA(Gln) amidotransferase subunit GatC [Lachnospiraceae bacterium]|nr:Asp-tRNA(Asn)/Glu-tRNA(Gln) amidotransferase subunit GatC [Lachnospiraceae bacterium]